MVPPTEPPPLVVCGFLPHDPSVGPSLLRATGAHPSASPLENVADPLHFSGLCIDF